MSATAKLSDAALLKRLVAFDTTSRLSNLPLLDFVADYLDRPGIAVRRFASPDGTKANLVVRAGPEIEGGGGLTLSWTGNASCNPADTDHAIYEGTLGDFTSHLPIACTTNNSHAWNFTPAAGNRYFLLVPINGTREGSYGLGQAGAERPQSAAACRPQLVTCP